MRWVNGFAARRISRKGKMPGMRFDALVLTTIGRRTGEERRSPLGWFPGPDGSFLIVAAAAGAPKNPAWYYNLAAHPDRVRVELPGRDVAVTAHSFTVRSATRHGSRSPRPRLSSASTRSRPTGSCR